MMRLSTKGRYGVRIMLELALYYGKGPMLLKNIAKNQEISEGYLEHLLPSLKSAGLVNSTRGAHGGYTLAKSPAKITLKDIILAMEGSLAPVECVDAPSVCRKVNVCVTREIWEELGQKILETLDSTTLEDIVTRYKKKQPDSVSYTI